MDILKMLADLREQRAAPPAPAKLLRRIEEAASA
jgi:hypothetical protein